MQKKKNIRQSLFFLFFFLSLCLMDLSRFFAPWRTLLSTCLPILSLSPESWFSAGPSGASSSAGLSGDTEKSDGFVSRFGGALGPRETEIDSSWIVWFSRLSLSDGLSGSVVRSIATSPMRNRLRKLWCIFHFRCLQMDKGHSNKLESTIDLIDWSIKLLQNCKKKIRLRNILSVQFLELVPYLPLTVL